MDFYCWLESLSRQGRDEFVGYYDTPGGRKYEVWIRDLGNSVASVSYLRSNKKGVGSFKEVLPQFIADLKGLGFADVKYSTAMDDETEGRSRDRLFNQYKSFLK